LSQPFFVAEVFTGSPGKYVKLEETLKGFQMILFRTRCLPEQAFYMVGNIDEAIAKPKQKLKASSFLSSPLPLKRMSLTVRVVSPDKTVWDAPLKFPAQ